MDKIKKEADKQTTENSEDRLLQKQKEYTDIFFANIKREGLEELFTWMLRNGFFEAPMSDIGRGARKGALMEHSVAVYHFLADSNARLKTPYPDESVAIVGLLSDLALTNAYEASTRRRKSADGTWATVPCYVPTNNFLVGGSEKSIIMLQSFFRSQFIHSKGENLVKSGMTNEEIMAIRWHLGEEDPMIRNGVYSLQDIFQQSTLAYLAAKAYTDVRYLQYIV